LSDNQNDKDKPEPPAASAARAGQPRGPQLYMTAAEMAEMAKPTGTRTEGLTFSPGLVAIPDSQVPGLGNGGMISHVMGPGQNAVDPIAAGLDVNYAPLTRHELRAPTLTGVDAAGLRPSTYAEKPGGAQVKQAADNTHETVAPKPDKDSGIHLLAAGEPAATAIPKGEGAPILAKTEVIERPEKPGEAEGGEPAHKPVEGETA
jgi:hypothetical protein